MQALRVRTGRDPAQLPALALAYMGDTVYDLYVRSFLLEGEAATAHRLHLKAIGYVCAKAQAEAFFRVEPLLSDAERAIYRRGRNAHTGSVPKNAEVAEYRVASGFEALLGWLFLSGADARLDELMGEALLKASIQEPKMQQKDEV